MTNEQLAQLLEFLAGVFIAKKADTQIAACAYEDIYDLMLDVADILREL